MEYTEGPWSTEPFGRDTFIVKDRGNGSARHIATVRHPDDVPLISAAPDLLAALEGMVGLWMVNESNTYCSACEAHAPCDPDGDPLAEIIHKPDCPVDIANEVISRAKGEGK